MEKGRSIERERFEAANRRVAEVQVRIAEQRRRMEKLRETSDEPCAEQLLAVMLETHERLLSIRRSMLYDFIEKKRQGGRRAGNEA